MTDDLPSGWAMARLESLIGRDGLMTDGDWVESKDQDPEGEVRLIQLADVGDGLFLDKSNRYLTRHKAEQLNCTFLAPRDVLISRLGEPLGKACLFPGLEQPCVTVVDVHVVRPSSDGVSREWLVHLLNTPPIRRAIDSQSSGTTRKRITGQKLKNLEVRVPPAAEQQRIASRINELFSRIDEGERALERVQALLERYRQSVLKAAVTGELTREWREKNKDRLESGEALLAHILKARREAWERFEQEKINAKGITPTSHTWKQKYEEPGEIVTDYLGEIPAGWQRIRVDAAGEVQLGRQRAPQHHSGAFMRPYLRVANVHEERIDTDDVMSMNFTPEEFATYAVRSGDVLLNEGQSKELVGRPAIYRGEISGCCFTNTLVRFRTTDAVLPAFALTVFLHYMKSGHFQRIAKITTNIAHLGAGRFAEMAFPVPPLEEQRAIIDAVLRQQSGYAHLLADLKDRTRYSARVRQAILMAAFAGQLTRQDSADEPASALLARLAKRGTDNAAPERRRRKKSAV